MLNLPAKHGYMNYTHGEHDVSGVHMYIIATLSCKFLLLESGLFAQLTDKCWFVYNWNVYLLWKYRL